MNNLGNRFTKMLRSKYRVSQAIKVMTSFPKHMTRRLRPPERLSIVENKGMVGVEINEILQIAELDWSRPVIYPDRRFVRG